MCINIESISLKERVPMLRMGLSETDMTLIYVKTTIHFLQCRILASQADIKQQLHTVHTDSDKQILALQEQVNCSEIHTTDLAETLANKTKSILAVWRFLFIKHQ